MGMSGYYTLTIALLFLIYGEEGGVYMDGCNSTCMEERSISDHVQRTHGTTEGARERGQKVQFPSQFLLESKTLEYSTEVEACILNYYDEYCSIHLRTAKVGPYSHANSPSLHRRNLNHEDPYSFSSRPTGSPCADHPSNAIQ